MKGFLDLLRRAVAAGGSLVLDGDEAARANEIYERVRPFLTQGRPLPFTFYAHYTADPLRFELSSVIAHEEGR